jgi:hypothetical protein
MTEARFEQVVEAHVDSPTSAEPRERRAQTATCGFADGASERQRISRQADRVGVSVSLEVKSKLALGRSRSWDHATEGREHRRGDQERPVATVNMAELVSQTCAQLPVIKGRESPVRNHQPSGAQHRYGDDHVWIGHHDAAERAAATVSGSQPHPDGYGPTKEAADGPEQRGCES